MNYLFYCGRGGTLSNGGTLEEEKYLLLPPDYLLMLLFGLDCLFVFNVKLFLIHLRKLAEVGGGTSNNFMNWSI